MKSRSGEKIKLTSIDELLGVVNEESAMEIEINRIHAFKDHPFKVLDDEKMADLVESVKTYGVLTPVLLRSDGENGYEMISGHRRMHAAVIAGLATIPAIVRDLSDDDAVIAMVDANIQREELLPSEKAFAYKMKLDAMKRQAGRPSQKNSGQNDQNFGKVSRDVLAKEVGESSKQIQRYIRLTELIPELLDMVDAKKLNFTIAVDISYIEKEIQKWIYEYIRDTGFVKPKQITALRKQLEEGPVTVEELMNDYSPRAMELAEKYLKELKPNIVGWEADFGKEMMTKNKAGLNMTWSGDAIWAIEEANAVGVDLDYVVPEEGSNIWYDGWVIPKYAKNPKAASYFINFMCRPDIALRNMDFCGYVSSVATPEILEEKQDTTLTYFSDLSYFFGPDADSIQIDKIQYPDRKVVERCAMIRDFGDKTKEVLDIWSRIKGDNLGVGITILIFVVVALMSGWMIYKRWQRYSRRKQQRRRSRRKKIKRS